MFQVIRSLVIVLLVITVNYSIGLKWIPLQLGDEIPVNAVSILDRGQKYVGRARHYDEVLPAEVNATHVIIESCAKKIAKRQYEILVSQNNCMWQSFSEVENIPLNAVRAGTAGNREPIYIGRITRNDISPPNNIRLESIYLTSKMKNKWSTGLSRPFVLVCVDDSNWIDTAAANIPNNTVSGRLSKDGNPIYVARLKSDCSIIPGQVTPELGIASAVYRNEKFESAYSQVLVGDSSEYKWVTANDGDIPDYAVVSSKDKSGELMYVTLMNKTLGYVTPSIAVKLNGSYDVLVKSVD